MPTHGRLTWHARETIAIAAPIALSQLAQMAMALTDTVMLGSLGSATLAAGGLGATIFFTLQFVLQAVLGAVAVVAARAVGRGDRHVLPAVYGSGLVLALLLVVPDWLLLSHARPLLLAAGETPAVATLAGEYLRVLRVGVPAALVGGGLLRSFLPAVGLQRALMWVVPAAVGLNAALNLVLIWGVHWHGLVMPGFGYRGSAAASAISLWAICLALLALLHGRANWRRHVRPLRADLILLRELLAIGLPVGATAVVEAALFLATGLLAGTLGPVVLAAHMIALSIASVSFMVPLAVAQAANVRVGVAAGAGDRLAARRAGLVAIGIGAAFMGAAGLMLWAVPGRIVGIYVNRADPANAAVAALAASLLGIAAVFQVADGVQVVASGALRGLKDTRVPMLLAAFGYWGIGFWAGRYLCTTAHLGAQGLWWGLCAGLATAAVTLSARFILKSAGVWGGSFPLHPSF